MQSSRFRFTRLDASLLLIALLQGGLGAAVLLIPQQPALRLLGAGLFGVLVWWNANTISHNHLHNPLFRSRTLNRLFSLYLTLVTGVPQTLWRAQHLLHHAGAPAGSRRRQLGVFGCCELALLGGLWLALAWLVPTRLVGAYLPGFGLGMLLCHLQGYYEHNGQEVDREPGVSYYGAAYNFLWFNDGYHAEHHRYPGAHWSSLPGRRLPRGQATQSALPPLLRFLEGLGRLANRWQARALVALERLALRPGRIQRFMLRTHELALRQLLGRVELGRGSPAPRIGIVGGGLFPRTALLLARLLPQAHLTLIDASAAHVALARATLLRAGIAPARFTLRAERFDPVRHRDFALLIFPLGFAGDRGALYRPLPGEPPRLIHDWVWRRRVACSVLVSPWLAKRLSLVRPDPDAESEPLAS